jgi:hypothetical protein
MFTTPLPCVKNFARDTILGRSHIVYLHTLTYLYTSATLVFSPSGMAFGEVTFTLLGCRP